MGVRTVVLQYCLGVLGLVVALLLYFTNCYYYLLYYIEIYCIIL